jgi:hypothetical protein
MKKFECSQETTGFLFCTLKSGNCVHANGYYHRYYGFGMYLYCYTMGDSEGRGYGTIYEDSGGWGDGKQGIVFLEEYPHHLIIL